MFTTADTILAIDLGRHKSVACVYQRSSREHTFRTLNTTPAELTNLLARHPDSLVVIEVCPNAGREAEDGGRRGVHAEAGDAVLRGAQEPQAVRPRLDVKNRHLTTRYLVRHLAQREMR